MDQGLAAVVSSAITGAIAIAGVGGTLMAARLSARVQRQQVFDQGVLEHVRWLRERKAAACVAALEASRRVKYLTGRWQEETSASPLPDLSSASSPEEKKATIRAHIWSIAHRVGAVEAGQNWGVARAQLALLELPLTHVLEAEGEAHDELVRKILSNLEYRVAERAGLEPEEEEEVDWSSYHNAYNQALAAFEDAARTSITAPPSLPLAYRR
ncbi:hypothetical protein ACFU96_41030 [Streptomyces sp. NPDC057620]|uniref:hypothetical protein n=1 Tax=Streptomyces sp. NPDC057620 TaxID=3346185 RepID=UPI0036C0296B